MTRLEAGPERVVLVQLRLGRESAHDTSEKKRECELLVHSAGGQVVATIEAKRASPDAASFLGKGKVAELVAAARSCTADLVVVNHPLTPGQQRNLERACELRVVDRSGLILDIFALRAVSAEGKLQVELAQCQYLASRLIRGWTHLERQQGGIGVRGPGETQLETDRRLLGKRVALLRDRLARLSKQRQVQRQARSRGDGFNVSLVGYTNAGKSTLFNALTHACAYAADQLFATLDTTSRKLWLNEIESQCIISDTVGFIRDLPHELIAAFHATLATTTEADLLVHVVDGSAPERDQQMRDVEQVLQQIGADAIPLLIVINKIDRLGLEPGLSHSVESDRITIRLSAQSGAGVPLLRSAIAACAAKQKSAILASFGSTLSGE